MGLLDLTRRHTTASKLASKPSTRPVQGSSTRGQAAKYFAELPRLRTLAGAPLSIAVFGKGGTGKSTTATAIAAIAGRLGHTVWLLDSDPQASALAWGALRPTDDVKVHRCPAPQIQAALADARKHSVDLVVVDNAPVQHQHALGIAAAADLVLLTCGASFFDLLETRRWVKFFQTINVQPHVILSLAPRRLNVGAPLAQDARQELLKILAGHSVRLWTGQVTRRNGVVEAVAAGLSTPEREILPARPPQSFGICGATSSIARKLFAHEEN
jgi:cellulose biosynthesis protein BcsQ